MKNFFTLTLIALIACPPSVVFADGNPVDKAQFNESPFPMCQNKAMLSQSVYEQDKAFWDQAKEECKGDFDLEVLPEAGIFQALAARIGDGKSDVERTVEMLRKVGDKTLVNLDANIKSSDDIEKCAKSPEKAECKNMLNALGASIAKVRPAARQQLALAAYEGTAKGWGNDKHIRSGDANKFELDVLTGKRGSINREQNTVLALDKMEPLTQAEADEAYKAFNNDTAKIKEEYNQKFEDLAVKAEKNGNKAQAQMHRSKKIDFSKMSSPNKDFLQEFVKQRAAKQEEHRMEYANLVFNRAPILAYLGMDKAAEKCAAGDNEGCMAVAKAAQKLKENASAEKNKLKGLLAKKDATPWDMLDIMKYGPALKSVLEQDSKYCSTATGMVNAIAKREGAKAGLMFASMIPAFGGAAFLGGAAATRLGLGATGSVILGGVAPAIGVGAAFSAHDYMNKEEAEQRTLANATEDNGTAIGDSKDLVAAKDQWAMSTDLFAGNLIGTGAFKMAGGMIGGAVAAGAGRASAKVAMQSAKANQALVKTLTESGKHSEQEASALVGKLRSKDANVAKAATRQIMDDLGFLPEATDLIQKAADKGLLSPITQRSALRAIKNEVNSPEVAKRAISIMDKMPKGAFNSGTAEEAFEAVLAGARLGIKNEEVLAANAKNWKEGLPQLRDTYKDAEAILKNKGIKNPSIKDIDGAIDEALEKRLVNSEDYMKATDEGKLAMKNSMKGCALGKIN